MMKIELVYPYAIAVKALYNTYKSQVAAYDPRFNAAYITTVLDPKIAAVLALITTDNLREANKEETAARNMVMDLMTPVLDNLEYRVKECITESTITIPIGKFGISAFKNSIIHKNFEKFRLCYFATLPIVEDNAEALDEVGFTDAMITEITTVYDNTKLIYDEKETLTGEISTLSTANQKILKDCLYQLQRVLDAIKAWAKSINDKDIAKKATQKAILRSITPTPEKKPIIKTIDPGSSIILHTDFLSKDFMQLLLLTNVVVLIARTALKDATITDGTELTYNEMWVGQKKDLIGTGRYIKITNTDHFQKARIQCFVEVVQLS